jgi:hypothetical protein
MDRKTALLFLEEWNEAHNKIEKAFSALNAAVGMSPESQVGEALWTSFGLYTDLLEEKIRPGELSHWLDWFCWDNDMGVKGLAVKPTADSELIPIRNLEDLVDVCFNLKEKPDA